jgi:hypothetical protein
MMRYAGELARAENGAICPDTEEGKPLLGCPYTLPTLTTMLVITDVGKIGVPPDLASSLNES